MAKKVEFYTITVYENGEKTDYSIMKSKDTTKRISQHT